MSISDLLDDWFESPQVKGLMAVNGIIGTWAGPCEPGTAYVMAHHSIGDVGDGQLGSWGYPEGGMGGVSAAIAKSARSFGAEIRTNAKVSRVLTSGGQVRGAVLENGDELTAPLVVTTLHPKIAFLDHLSPAELPDDFVSDIEHFKTRSGVVKINVALSELPSFTADPSSGMAEHLTGSIEMAPSIDYLEAAFQEARVGKPAVLPFSDGVIPTTLDKTLNPDGTHIMSLFTQWVPAEWADAPHTEELDAYADRVIDTYDQVAPGFKASITHRDVVGPHEMRAGVRPDRRQHLPRRAVAGAAVPHATGTRLRRLPHADRRAVQRQFRHACRRRRVRHPRLAGEPRGARRQEEGLAAVPPLSMSSRRASVAAMLGARSMALVGASPRPDSFGSRMILEAQRGSARFHLVNPRYDRIGELPCVPSIADLDEPVDVVLLGVPDAVLADQLAAAAAAGAKSAVLFGSAHGLRG